MATRADQIAAWEAKGYSTQLATQIVDDLEGPAKTAAPLPTAPVGPAPRRVAGGSSTHHQNCGVVGVTGTHGALGSNAAPLVAANAAPAAGKTAGPAPREAKISAYVKAGYSQTQAEAFVQ
jgi:hypothetical protein